MIRKLLAILALAMMISVIRAPYSESWLRKRVIQLTGNGGACTGEQIKAPSGKNYVLTAAHCRSLAVKEALTGTLEGDKKEYTLKIVAEDPTSDILLLEGIPGLSGIRIASSVEMGSHLRTLTHGHRYNTYMTEGVLVQDERIYVGIKEIGSEQDMMACNLMPKYRVAVSMFGPVCVMSVNEFVTTAFVTPGSSGGPVLDDSGKLVAVVSAGGEGFGYLVRLSDIQSFLSKF